MGTAVAPVRVDARPWARRAGGIAVLVAVASCLPGGVLVLLTAVAVVAAAAVGAVRHGIVLASGLLPAAERAGWRAEVRAVLDAAPDRRERRRQLRGFVAGLPSCVATSWSLVLRRG